MKSSAAAAMMMSALALAGCAAQTPEEYNAGRGAILGGATGALIGGLATGRPAGALAGAAIGAGSGAVLGAAATPRPLPPIEGDDVPVAGDDGPGPGPRRRCARMGYDEDGRPVCLKLAGYPRP